MLELYDGSEYERERRRKKLWLTVWLVVTVLVFLANVGLFVYFWLQPYQWSGRTTLFVIQIVNVAVYGCLSFAFFALKYRRLKCYCKVLKNMNTGLKEIDTAEYLGVSAADEVKEGVDFFVLLFLEWNDKKQNYFERKLLVDKEKELPALQEGDIVHFVTQANMLFAWEVLPRPADEPSIEEKKQTMTAKDRELLADNVVLDADGLKELKKNRRKDKKARLEKAREVERELAESAERRADPFPEQQPSSQDEEEDK